MQSPSAVGIRRTRRAIYTILSLLSSAVGPRLAAADIAAASLFETAGPTVTLSAKSSDVLVFSESENDEYVLNGRDLVINASRIRVLGRVVIRGFSTPALSGGGGATGGAGMSFNQAPDCASGWAGGDGRGGGAGAQGTSGGRGSNVKVDVRQIDGTGTLLIVATGQIGGSGGPGGRGGQGGQGEAGGNSRSGFLGCTCSGGNGGPGGNGGTGGSGGAGGVGGDGGTIILSPRTAKLRQHFLFEAGGGEGGDGGRGGDGGGGGNGGAAGGGGGFCGGGHGAGPGRPGGSGFAGKNGPVGRQGIVVNTDTD